jgi:2-C-methyl-D-erythritol 4-phosphate cytidylyltransferase
MKTDVLICAAGQGKRMGLGHNKLFLELQQVPVLIHTIKVWEGLAGIRKIILVVAADEIEIVKEMLQDFSFSKEISLVVGGSERQESVLNGILSYQRQEEPEYIMIHDGARPFITETEIESVLDAAVQSGAAILAVPAKDTIKRVSQNLLVQETLDRSTLWSVQTPQAFQFRELLQAYKEAAKDGYLGTDDASLLERKGIPVQIVQGSYDNIKLTTLEDITIAEHILKKKEKQR